MGSFFFFSLSLSTVKVGQLACRRAVPLPAGRSHALWEKLTHARKVDKRCAVSHVAPKKENTHRNQYRRGLHTFCTNTIQVCATHTSNQIQNSQIKSNPKPNSLAASSIGTTSGAVLVNVGSPIR
ncbi:hypothetical protein T484DRAFT_2945103 [Baffinella frigidus]|nr:hypothetical protein T484DRAFT_2945103 [Cryptophyta sp. CCMP2293]